MIALVDRYLFSEVFKALLAILLLLVLVIVSHSFIRLLEMVAIGRLNPDALAQLMGLQLLRLLPRLIPPALFFAVLFALGRLYRDSEMIALQACGLGPLRTYRALLMLTLPLMLFTGWLSLASQPWTAGEMNRITEAQKAQAAELAAVEEGRFNEYSQGDLVLYVESFTDDGKMRNIFVQHRRQQKIGLVTAETAYQITDQQTGDLYLVLADGHRYEGVPGEATYSVGEFDRYALRIDEATQAPSERQRKALSSAELARSGDLADAAELQERLSYPLAVLAFAVVSIPLSRSLPRQGIYGRMLFALLIYFIVVNLQGVAKNWMEQGTTAAWLGTWWVQALLIMIGLLLLLPETSWMRRLQRKLRREERS